MRSRHIKWDNNQEPTLTGSLIDGYIRGAEGELIDLSKKHPYLKKIQDLEKSLAEDEFDEEQVNKMRVYEKEVFHLVFQIDKVLIDDNERAYDDKQEFDELSKEQIAVQDKAQSLFDRAKFLREQLNMLQDWNDDMDDEDRNESLDILT